MMQYYVFVSIKVKLKYGDISFENITQPEDCAFSSLTFVKKKAVVILWKKTKTN